MPIAETHAFWAFLGATLGVIATFAIAILRLFFGKDTDFQRDLMHELDAVRREMHEQRVFYEGRLEEMRQRHRADLKAMREQHLAEIAALREEYHSHGAS